MRLHSWLRLSCPGQLAPTAADPNTGTTQPGTVSFFCGGGCAATAGGRLVRLSQQPQHLWRLLVALCGWPSGVVSCGGE